MLEYAHLNNKSFIHLKINFIQVLHLAFIFLSSPLHIIYKTMVMVATNDTDNTIDDENNHIIVQIKI